MYAFQFSHPGGEKYIKVSAWLIKLPLIFLQNILEQENLALPIA